MSREAGGEKSRLEAGGARKREKERRARFIVPVRDAAIAISRRPRSKAHGLKSVLPGSDGDG